tara:strand:- start:16216 stop:16710 length:495 start_codon:yes stop_codon:yes gene_type:complete
MDPKQILESGIYVGKKILFPKKSVKYILQNLSSVEEILLLTSCNAKSLPGAIALTNKRILFGGKNFFSSELFDIALDKITSVNLSSGMTNKLEILGSSSKLECGAIDKEAGKQIVKKIKELQSGPKETASSMDLSQLEKLADLKDKGIITEEEFQTKKKEILGL